MTDGRLSPAAKKRTEWNRHALPIYHEAVRILELPFSMRRAEIEKHKFSERLAAEVIRLHKLRAKK